MGTPDTAAPAAVPKGHPTGFWFFFWGEFAERSSYYGMRAILALYFTERLGFTKEDGGTAMAVFMGACYLLPLLGGYIADNYFGKYWTIVGFSLPYLCGHFLVGIENKYAVLFALALLAMGSGVIKPNISTLMGLTYDQQRPGQSQLRADAFSWFYLAINIGAFISQVGVPYVRTHYGYQLAFAFPTLLMVIALAIFASGKKYYAVETRERPKLSPEEAAEDRRLKMQTLGRISLLFLLVMFFWAVFDQSASTWVYFAETYMNLTLFGVPVDADGVQAFNAFFIMALLPLSVLIFNRAAKAGYPVKATQKITVGFLLTAVAMAAMAAPGFLAGQKQTVTTVVFPEGKLVVPAWTGSPEELVKESEAAAKEGKQVAAGTGLRIASADWRYDADKKKISFANGFFLTEDGRRFEVKDGHLQDIPDAAALTAGGRVLEPLLKSPEEAKAVGKEPARVEIQEGEWVAPEQRVTVWWQVLAYLVLTVAEILISVTGLELAYVAAPSTMKGFVTGCWLFTVFLANWMINVPLAMFYPKMHPGVYFAMLAGVMVLVTLLFLPIAAKFNRHLAATAPKDEGPTEAK